MQSAPESKIGGPAKAIEGPPSVDVSRPARQSKTDSENRTSPQVDAQIIERRRRFGLSALEAVAALKKTVSR